MNHERCLLQESMRDFLTVHRYTSLRCNPTTTAINSVHVSFPFEYPWAVPIVEAIPITSAGKS